MTYDADVAIIGGGVIGTTATLALQDNGFRTLLFEPSQVGLGTAEGSASHIHDGEIFPLAEPALLYTLPKMLLDPLGPLVIRAAYAPRLAGWGLRFIAAMPKRRRHVAIAALASLNRLAVDAIVNMASSAGAQDLLVRGGGVKVCRDPKSLALLAGELEDLRREGIAAKPLDAGELRAMEPAVTDRIAGGVFFPTSAHCIDLQALGKAFAARIAERGTIVNARVTALYPRDGAWTIDYGGAAGAIVPRVLIAGGHASGDLLRPLGYRVPLAPGRGYHLMLSDPGVELHHPIIFHEPHFGATPMRSGIRLAGTMEFTRADAPPSMQRAEALFRIARPYLPNLMRGGATTWMGVRPMSPDSLPMIGRAARHENLFYAFGHGHLGLTQSAITARCIADLVAERAPPIAMQPFDLTRFQ